MLCSACEQRFAVWEKAFAENCFDAILSGNADRVRYQAWMLKFATSVSWRVLCAFKAFGGLSGFPAHLVSAADTAVDVWGEFLLDRRPHPDAHEQHMFLVDAVVSSTVSNMPTNINRYLLRAIEIYIAHTDDSVITYAKMGRFVLFGFVAMPHPRRWKGTKLNAKAGAFGVRNIELPAHIGDFVMDRARRAANRYAGISARQHAKIGESNLHDLDRAENSETFRAMHHDVLLFGDEAFEVTRLKKKPNSD